MERVKVVICCLLLTAVAATLLIRGCSGVEDSRPEILSFGVQPSNKPTPEDRLEFYANVSSPDNVKSVTL